MIIVTGAAGFIGSNLVKALNERGVTDILAVDDLREGDKFRNLVDCHIADYMDKDEFRRYVLSNGLPQAEAILHQGACSDTMETNGAYMLDNNYRVSMELLEWCESTRTRFIYASSAATYGMGPEYRESPACEGPLNVYGYSKLLFDQIVRRRWDQLKTQVVGLRYFNVYGPREQHKGRMASVAYHQFHQFRNEAHVKLFEGTDGYGHGQQERDFIYVDDVCEVNLFFLENESKRGIFNCGTGRAQPFNAVSHTVINTLRQQQGLNPLTLQEQADQHLLRYVPFPPALVGKYQSYTQADTTRLREAGYENAFHTVEEGVAKYMQVLAGKA